MTGQTPVTLIAVVEALVEEGRNADKMLELLTPDSIRIDKRRVERDGAAYVAGHRDGVLLARQLLVQVIG